MQLKIPFVFFYFIISFLYNKDHFQQLAIRLNVITLLMLIDKSKKDIKCKIGNENVILYVHLHSSPMYPIAHPLKHVPFTW